MMLAWQLIGLCLIHAVAEQDTCKAKSCSTRTSRDHLLLQVSKPTLLDVSGNMALPAANESDPQIYIKVMSYNLMGWSSFNANRWKGQNVLGKINALGPDILGAQEVEMGGWGYQEVENLVSEATGLLFAGGSQFFRPQSLEVVETDWAKLVGGYWMSMVLYKHKGTGNHILFYDSHWKHGHGMKQAKIISEKIQKDREKYGSPPTVLVGDTNQFCKGYELEAIRYLTGREGSSPVVFADVHEEDKGRSFSDTNNPDCRVDFILASTGQWSVVHASIDRVGMGAWGAASDHAPLLAHLVPIFAD